MKPVKSSPSRPSTPSKELAPAASPALARFRLNRAIAEGSRAPEDMGELDIMPFDDWETLCEQMLAEDHGD